MSIILYLSIPLTCFLVGSVVGFFAKEGLGNYYKTYRRNNP